MSILDLEAITLKAALGLVPGRTRSLSTIYRWATRGCKGHRLKTFLVGGERMTTRRHLEEFLVALNGGTPPIRLNTGISRQSAIEKACSEVDAELN